MAELPRYESQIQQTQTDVSPAIQGVRAATTGQMVLEQSLTDRLSSFFGTTEDIVRPLIEEKAYTEALQATDYDRKSRWTMYGQAYNKALDVKYAADSDFEARVKAATLGKQYKDNPKAFLQMYMEAAKPEIDGAPTSALKRHVQQSYRNQGAKEYERLLRLNVQSQVKKNSDSYAGYLKVLTQDYYSAISNGDENGANDVAMKITQLTTSAVNQGIVTDGEAAAAERELVSGGYRMNQMRLFEDAFNNGTHMEFIENFGKQKHEVLTEDQQNELTSSMLKLVKDRNDFFIQSEKIADAQEKAMQENNFNTFKYDVVSGNLSEQTVKSAWQNGDISLQQRDVLLKAVSDPGPVFDHEPTYLQASMYLTEMSELEILDLQNLTYATRRKLVADREQAMKTRLKWTTTENGREALRRVKMKFGIMEGTIMAQIDLENTNMKNFDAMHRALFDEVMSLPEDDRENKVLGIANRMMTQYDEDEARKLEEEKKRTEQKVIDVAQGKANTFNSNAFNQFLHTWLWGDLTSWPEQLPQSYKYLGTEYPSGKVE